MNAQDEYDPLRPYSAGWSVSRVLSLLVILSYAVFAFVQDDFRLLSRLLLMAAVPTLCIWYPNVTSSVTSGLLGWRDSVDDPPEGLVQGLAWVALLAPVWIVAIAAVLSL
jgi:hypothetical protein